MEENLSPLVSMDQQLLESICKEPPRKEPVGPVRGIAAK